MVDFSKKNTKESGGKFADRDWTFTNCRWEDKTAGSGFRGIYFVSDLEGPDGVQEKRWLLGDADKLSAKLRVAPFDDRHPENGGTLEDVDDDNPYQPRTQDETAQLFNSLEDAGVSGKILQNIGANPSGLDGTTAHLVEKPTGRKQKKNGVETQYDQTWLIAESLVDDGGGKKTKSAAGKSAPAATAKKGKPAPVVEEEEEEETDGGDDPVTQAAVATIQAVLAKPKTFVATYNKKQNGGGLTLVQMRTAALGNAVPSEHRMIGKAEISKVLGKPDIYEQFAGEYWSFDSDEGVVNVLDE